MMVRILLSKVKIMLLIYGVVGTDSLETPFGKAENILGGSASHAALAASYFCPVSLSAVVGENFDEKHLQFFEKHQIDTKTVARRGRTFFWRGRYQTDVNAADTLETQLGSVKNHHPRLSASQQKAEYVFLANSHPRQQIEVISQLKNPRLIMADTMNFWINSQRRALKKLCAQINVLCLNDQEARLLSGVNNLALSAKFILKLGPQVVIIKKGEHGALMFSQKYFFHLAGYPLEIINDPTGCGDSFAGGLIGYLASQNRLDRSSFRRGMVFGSAVASFCAELFGTGYRNKTTLSDIRRRFLEFQKFSKI